MSKFLNSNPIFDFGTQKDRIEELINFDLPQDFIDFIKVNNSAQGNELCLRYNGKTYLFSEVLDFLLPIEDGRSPFSYYDHFQDRIPQGLFPFASEASGDLFCYGKPIGHGEDKMGIYYHHHEGVITSKGHFEFKTFFLFETISLFVENLIFCYDEGKDEDKEGFEKWLRNLNN